MSAAALPNADSAGVRHARKVDAVAKQLLAHAPGRRLTDEP